MLKVKNLTFEVNEEGKKRCLVNHISFDVHDGEMLVITGPNGGGKSTLAKVPAGRQSGTQISSLTLKRKSMQPKPKMVRSLRWEPIVFGKEALQSTSPILRASQKATQL